MGLQWVSQDWVTELNWCCCHFSCYHVVSLWGLDPAQSGFASLRRLPLLLSHLSRVRLCATPSTAAHPAPPVPGILQARTLEGVAISFSNAWKWKVKVKSLRRVWLFATYGLQPTRLLHPWAFPGKSAGVGAIAFSLLVYPALEMISKAMSHFCV